MQSDHFADEGPLQSLLGPPPDASILLSANSAAEMTYNSISIRPLDKADYDFIVRVIDNWAELLKKLCKRTILTKTTSIGWFHIRPT